jgi:hypothetical protein
MEIETTELPSLELEAGMTGCTADGTNSGVRIVVETIVAGVVDIIV